LRLFVLTAVAAILLGVVYDITADPILQRQQESEAAAVQSIFATADESRNENMSDENITRVLSVFSAGELIGWAIFTSPTGYGGSVDLLVAIGADGGVKGLQILNHSETPGLGANANSPSFLDQYQNKKTFVKVVKAAPGDDEVLAITSATITSEAVTKGVNNAIAFAAQNLEVQP
jgi:electron transport complex protein RnfG